MTKWGCSCVFYGNYTKSDACYFCDFEQECVTATKEKRGGKDGKDTRNTVITDSHMEGNQ